MNDDGAAQNAWVCAIPQCQRRAGILRAAINQLHARIAGLQAETETQRADIRRLNRENGDLESLVDGLNARLNARLAGKHTDRV